MSKIAWIGLGHMVSRCRATWCRPDTPSAATTSPRPRREAAQSNGVEIAESIADAVRDADAVFTMLHRQSVEQVVTGPDGAFANMPKGTVVVDCSTIGIDTARSLAAEAKNLGVGFVDALSPAVWRVPRTEPTLMLGGDIDHVAAAEPLLKSVGTYIVHVGPSGDSRR